MFCFIIRRVGLKLVESYQGIISHSQSKFRLPGMQHDVIIQSSSVVAINVTFGTNENKVNSLIVTYVVEPRKNLKCNQTQLLLVDTC